MAIFRRVRYERRDSLEVSKHDHAVVRVVEDQVKRPILQKTQRSGIHQFIHICIMLTVELCGQAPQVKNQTFKQV